MNGLYLTYIADKTDELCIAALQENPKIFHNITNPSDNVIKFAVELLPQNLEYLNDCNKMYEIFSSAIEKDPKNIIYTYDHVGNPKNGIKDRIFELINLAISNDPDIIRTINPALLTDEQCEKVIEKMPNGYYMLPAYAKSQKLWNIAIEKSCINGRHVPKKFMTKEILAALITNKINVNIELYTDIIDDEIIQLMLAHNLFSYNILKNRIPRDVLHKCCVKNPKYIHIFDEEFQTEELWIEHIKLDRSNIFCVPDKFKSSKIYASHIFYHSANISFAGYSDDDREDILDFPTFDKDKFKEIIDIWHEYTKK